MKDNRAKMAKRLESKLTKKYINLSRENCISNIFPIINKNKY